MALFEGLRLKLTAMMDFAPETSPEFRVFLHKRPTKVDLGLYAEHLSRQLGLSDDVIALAYWYIVKLKETNPQFQLEALNASRVLLTSVVVACKFAEDDHVLLKNAAKAGGLPVRELVRMEACFLKALGWNLPLGDTSELKAALHVDLSSTADHTSESDDDEYFAGLSYEDNQEYSELSAFF